MRRNISIKTCTILALAAIVIAAPGETSGAGFNDGDRAFLDEFVKEKDPALRKRIFEKNRARVNDEWLSTVLNGGLAIAGQGRVDEGLLVMERAGEIASLAGDKNAEALSGFNRGYVLFYYRGDRVGANRAFEDALSLYRSAGNARGEASCIGFLGEMAFYGTDYARARDLTEKSIALYRKSGDVMGEATGHVRLGDIAFYSRDRATAVKHYDQAVVLYRRIGSILGEANYMYKMGEIFEADRNYAKAADYVKQALSLYRREGSAHGEANCVKKLGDYSYNTFDYKGAIHYYEKALSLYRAQGLQMGVTACIHNMADISFYTSNLRKARELYEEAIEQYRKSGNAASEAACLKMLGDVEFYSNDYTSAKKLYEESEGMYRRAGNIVGVANCKWGLGNIAMMTEEYDRAVELYLESSDLYRKTDTPGGEANSLKRLGEIALRRKSDITKASEFFRKTIPLYRKAGDIMGEANALNDLGQCAFLSSEYRKAADLLEKASGIYRRIDIKSSMFTCDTLLARTFLALGEIPKAKKALVEALTAALSARSTAGSESVRIHFQERAAETIKVAVIEMAAHDAGYALEQFEQFRGRSFLDALSGHQALAAAGIEEKDMARWRELFDRQVQAGVTLKAVYESKSTDDQKAAAYDEASKSERALEKYEAELARRYEKYRVLKNAGGDISASRSALLPGETALVYIVSGDRCGVWTVTANAIRYIPLDIKPADLTAKVDAYRRYLIDNGSTRGLAVAGKKIGELSGGLSSIVEKPLAGIAPGSRIVIVPDGATGLLPWESLAAGGRPLSSSYDICFAPSLGVLAMLRGRDYSKLRRIPFVAFGGARYEKASAGENKEIASIDPSARGKALENIMTRGFRESGFADLPGAEEEVKRAVELYYGNAKDREAALFMKEWASEPALKSLDRGIAGGKTVGGRGIRLSDARVLHFAVHGKAEAEFPETSRIVLSQPGALSAADRRAMASYFPAFPNEDGSVLAAEIVGLTVRADLVVLSACETGAGRVTATEGIVGLTRSWMVAGANGVVVSLWEVSDIGTRVFMTHYHRLLAAGKSPRGAIGQVREMLRTGSWRTGEFAPDRTFDEDGERVPFGKLDLSSPYYWAAFQYWGR